MVQCSAVKAVWRTDKSSVTDVVKLQGCINLLLVG